MAQSVVKRGSVVLIRCVNTMGLGLKAPDEHVQTPQRFRKEAGV